MIDPYVAAGYAAGLLLAALLAVMARKGLSGDIGSLRLLFTLSGAFFAVLTIASFVERGLFAAAGSVASSVYEFAGWAFAFAALAAFGFLRMLGRLERTASGSLPQRLEGGTVNLTGKPLFQTRISFGGKQSASDVSSLLRSMPAVRPPGGTPLVQDGPGAVHWRMAIFDPKGALDASSAATLTHRIEAACAAGPAKIVLDFSELTSLDGTAAQAIAETCGRFPGSSFSIVAPNDSVAYRTLAALGIDKTIPLEPALPLGNSLRDIVRGAEARVDGDLPSRDARPGDEKWKGF